MWLSIFNLTVISFLSYALFAASSFNALASSNAFLLNFCRCVVVVMGRCDGKTEETGRERQREGLDVDDDKHLNLKKMRMKLLN